MVTKRSNIKRENDCDQISCAFTVDICLIDACFSDTFIDKVEHGILSLIWNGKPPKGKVSTMILDIFDGGLKMAHFRTMVKSQKVTWIQHLLANQCFKF